MDFSSFYTFLCSKLFHVRPVTQGDVYRAETDEIPRIFQVGFFLLLFLNVQFYFYVHISMQSWIEFAQPQKQGPVYLSLTIQILYANEGECRKEADLETVPQGDKTNCLPHKGHEFIPTLYHFPSNCEACAKPLWHVFKPPPALECRRCHVKCHKDHLDKKEDVIAPCKGKTQILISAG